MQCFAKKTLLSIRTDADPKRFISKGKTLLADPKWSLHTMSPCAAGLPTALALLPLSCHLTAAAWLPTPLSPLRPPPTMYLDSPSTTKAPPRWNRFFQQLADPKTALQPLTEMLFFFLLLCCAHRDDSGSLYPRTPILGNWHGRLGTPWEKTKTQNSKNSPTKNNHNKVNHRVPSKRVRRVGSTTDKLQKVKNPGSQMVSTMTKATMRSK